MALQTRSTNLPVDEAYDKILGGLRSIQSEVENMASRTAAGPVSWLTLISHSNNLAIHINNIDTLVANTNTPALIAYAQSVHPDSTSYDVAAEYATMKGNASSARSYIKANIPNAPGSHSTDEWGQYQLSQYQSSDTAVYRTDYLAVLQNDFD